MRPLLRAAPVDGIAGRFVFFGAPRATATTPEYFLRFVMIFLAE